MRLPVPIRRAAFRLAWALLQVYRFVRRPRVAGVKCVLTDGSRLLLVRHTYGPDEWELPGGTAKRGERPANAARREMREELGITVEDWLYLGEVFGHLRYQHDILHCFQAQIDGAQLTIDRGEIERAEWFAPEDLPPNLGRYVKPILARARLR